MNITEPCIELMMWEEDKFVSAHAFIAFLWYFWFWMGDIEVVRWNGVDFLVPKHLRKSKIGLLEQIWAKNPYVTFFWVTLYIFKNSTNFEWTWDIWDSFSTIVCITRRFILGSCWHSTRFRSDDWRCVSASFLSGERNAHRVTWISITARSS